MYIKDGGWQVRPTLIMYYRGWGSANPSPQPLSGMRFVVGGEGDQMRGEGVVQGGGGCMEL